MFADLLATGSAAQGTVGSTQVDQCQTPVLKVDDLLVSAAVGRAAAKERHNARTERKKVV